MKVAIFDTHRYDKEFFTKANQTFGFELSFIEPRLTAQTALLAQGQSCVCCFVNDCLDAETLGILKTQGVRLIALRSAGFNNVDLKEAARLGIRVCRVPAYSPHAVAEHAVALILALNRKIYRAYDRVRDHNFSLDGLVGFDLNGKTVGIIGTGKIGTCMATIMKGFGCRVLAYDPRPDETLTENGIAEYVSLPELYRSSDIISLHVPLLPETRHMIGTFAVSQMKPGVVLINTGRGGLIDTPVIIDGLKSGQISAAGLDVYEEEEGIFYENLSDLILKDDVLARLLTFPNVLITSHQAFLTKEALTQIAGTTLQNIADYEKGVPLVHEVQEVRELRRA